MQLRHRSVITMALAGLLLILPSFALAQVAAPGATLVQTASTDLQAAIAVGHSHSTGATITITVPAGQYAYVTGLDISNCQGSAVTAAAPTYVTTTGLNGSPQWVIGSGPATAGTCSPTATFAFAKSLKSQTAGTNVTFVLPTFVTNQVVGVNVYYYLGF